MAALEEPKKPQVSYWLWLSENREQLAKEAGTARGAEVGKLGGQKWKALSAAAKKPFETKAAELKKEYDAKMAEFVAAGGVKGKRRMEKAEKKGTSSKKAKKEARAASGQPKKPQTAYFLYLNDNRAAIQKEAGSKALPAVAKFAGQKWKGLSEALQKPYQAKAAAAKAEYDKAMAEWKEKNAGDEGGDDEEDEEHGEEQ